MYDARLRDLEDICGGQGETRDSRAPLEDSQGLGFRVKGFQGLRV